MSSSPLRRLAAPLALLLLAAAACTEPGSTSSELWVELDARAPYADLSLFRVTAVQGPTSAHIDGRDLASDRSSSFTAHAFVDKIPVTRLGTLRVRVRMLSAAGDTVAASEVTFDAADDMSYGVVAQAGGTRAPQGMCGGTVRQAVALPLRAGQTAPDTLFVRTMALPKRAVC